MLGGEGRGFVNVGDVKFARLIAGDTPREVFQQRVPVDTHAIHRGGHGTAGTAELDVRVTTLLFRRTKPFGKDRPRGFHVHLGLQGASVRHEGHHFTHALGRNHATRVVAPTCHNSTAQCFLRITVQHFVHGVLLHRRLHDVRVNIHPVGAQPASGHRFIERVAVNPLAISRRHGCRLPMFQNHATIGRLPGQCRLGGIHGCSEGGAGGAHNAHLMLCEKAGDLHNRIERRRPGSADSGHPVNLQPGIGGVHGSVHVPRRDFHGIGEACAQFLFQQGARIRIRHSPNGHARDGGASRDFSFRQKVICAIGKDAQTQHTKDHTNNDATGATLRQFGDIHMNQSSYLSGCKEVARAKDASNFSRG